MIFLFCYVSGDEDVGKSSLLLTYEKREATKRKSYVPTVVDRYRIPIEETKTERYIEFHDITTRQGYQEINEPIIKTLDVALLCYDVTNRESFENLEKVWNPEVMKFSPKCKIILVGLKTDLIDTKLDYISVREARGMSNKMKAFSSIRCSCYLFDEDPDQVDKVFELAIKTLFGPREPETELQCLDECFWCTLYYCHIVFCSCCGVLQLSLRSN